MMKNRFIVILMCVACVFTVPSYAQSGKQPTEEGFEKTDKGVVLNFQNTDIHALINLVSEVTGKNFVVDPRVKAKVTLYSGSELDETQIYDVFLSVLDVHNLSAVAVGNLTKVVPVASGKQLPLPTNYNQESGSQIPDDLVTQVYKLKNATPADVLPVIRPLIPAESHVAIHPRSGTLVFTDTSANVRRILNILNYLDVEDTNFNIRIIPLKFAEASKLREAISALIGDVVSEGENGATSKKATVYAEESSNSLIINGSDEAFAIISAVVENLDKERPKTRDVHVVNLNYAKAVDMASILTEVGKQISPTAKDATDALSVQVHEATNSLIVYANAVDFLALKSVIDKLDVRRKQVFIEAIIAEVSLNKAADLGIEWNGNINSGGGGTAGTNFSDISSGFSFNIVNELVLNSVGAVVPDLSFVLNALRSDSNTNILSTPNLLTIDNEKAEIVVGQQVPFITGQFTTNQSTTTTNTDANNTTNTSVNPFQTIERRDVGLKLTVTPRVNTEGLVTMVVEQEISNVSPRLVQGASDLVTDERRISATVQAESGKIIVIGGLIRDDVFETDEKVPLLGDIPILGNLFKRRNDQIVKTNLMVFLRPRIVDAENSISDYTREKYDYIRNQSEKQLSRSEGLLKYDDVDRLSEFNSGAALDVDNGVEKSSNDTAEESSNNNAELIEAIWRYALPENVYQTQKGF
ncbi:MAG: type II secretion system secretin GspD [Arenicella sp.]